MDKKKVLITGVTGMVGSHLLDYLFENSDFEIHGIWRELTEISVRQYTLFFANVFILVN